MQYAFHFVPNKQLKKRKEKKKKKTISIKESASIPMS